MALIRTRSAAGPAASGRLDVSWLARPLASDLRFQMFGLLFALGLLGHEVLFVLEQQRTGPLTDYLARWTAIKPSLGWPTELGLAIHAANALLALLLLALPRKRELLGLAAVPFWLSLLASPERTSAHSSLLAAALLVVLVFDLAELWERRVAGGGPTPTDWYRWTLIGLMLLLSLTYLFSAFHKLNPVWFSYRDGKAVDFIKEFVQALNLPRGGLAVALGYLAMYGTVVLEAGVPLLLLRRTRLLGFFLGLLLHLPMLGFGVLDFPIVALAFYPLFMQPDEARALLARLRARPSIWRIGATLVMGGAGLVVLGDSAHAAGLYEDSPGLWPPVMVAHVVLLRLVFLLVVYALATVGAQILGGRGSGGPATPKAATSLVRNSLQT
jgi:hypothetical protein